MNVNAIEVNNVEIKENSNRINNVVSINNIEKLKKSININRDINSNKYRKNIEDVTINDGYLDNMSVTNHNRTYNSNTKSDMNDFLNKIKTER